MKKKTQIVFWIATALFCLVFTAGGIANLVRWEHQVGVMQNLGYPLYVMTILGTAKVLGVIALLLPGLPRLKEWAYAGFAFDMLGAAASHGFVGDPIGETIAPLVILTVGAVSYLTRPDSRKVIAMMAQPQDRQETWARPKNSILPASPQVNASQA